MISFKDGTKVVLKVVSFKDEYIADMFALKCKQNILLKDDDNKRYIATPDGEVIRDH
jgi:hypothetical protein